MGKHLRQSSARAPTLDDVARAAGLSAMTVSRALNTPQRVRPATVTKVLAAVTATGYIPNALAGGLASSKSRLIALVVPQINNPMFVDTIQALNDALAQRGYTLLLCVTGYSETTEADSVATILARRPDGIVLTGIHHTQALKRVIMQAAVPVVEIWDMTPTPLDMLVGFSHEKAGHCLGNFLAQKGYSRPALIWTDDRRGRLRKQGVIESFYQHGITISAEISVPLPASLQLGREALAALLDNQTGCDVIVCSSDTLAQGAIMETQARQLSVPQQLAVSGFGDLAFAAWNQPAITTVHIDRAAIGRTAATLLADRIAGLEIAAPIIDIGFTMVERDSA
ncbi:LacI family gluconate utilization system Gnt-I transcriptional repressor [Erwinia toletana]|uniref:LacI family gluconate utilization system Gnt-I transcriptional repressor n=1 Tax=Winslowiella toletana TaxID=92490 RepID=A0ABS4PE08_9GAMM|nr:LacI family DNA-binding transcriptional regulator [Winslowiella toletana]MBP2170866.1 LacI family gluconate utilization system Gnt-I transcriptional repressor [Winslowiella toletana]